MYRKIITICISMISDTVIFGKGALVLALNSASLLYHSENQPFVDSRLNYLEDLAIKISILTIFGGLFYLQDIIGDLIQALIFILIVVINCFFAIMWIKIVILFAFRRFIQHKFGKNLSFFMKNLKNYMTDSINKFEATIKSTKKRNFKNYSKPKRNINF